MCDMKKVIACFWRISVFPRHPALTNRAFGAIIKMDIFTGQAATYMNTEKKKNLTLKITLTAIFAALIVVLQVVGGIPAGPFSITLTLVPIVVGAILLGPVYGLVLGLIFGIIVSILSLIGRDPGGYLVFAANPFMAWALCLLKGAMAGLLPALFFRLFNERKAAPYVLAGISGVFLFLGGVAFSSSAEGGTKSVIAGAVLSLVAAGYLILVYFALKSDKAAYYIASMTAPVANTGIFIIGMMLFFRPLLETWAGGSDVFVYAITGLAGINFLIEFAVAVIFAPSVALIIKNANKALGGKG